MGWQGRMRQAKADRLFAKLPESLRRSYKLEKVRCHRDNLTAHVFMEDANGNSVVLRVDRKSGIPVPYGQSPNIEPAYNANIMGRRLK